MGLIVSDTSPILALAHLGCLDLLSRLYNEVTVPGAVAAELCQPRIGLPAVDVSQLPFVRVQSPNDRQRVSVFLQRLDVGEAEALALALEVQADAVLTDEKFGRLLATRNGITTVGTLGVLLRAKVEGHIPTVRPLMDRLIQEINFRVAPRVQADVLQRAGE